MAKAKPYNPYAYAPGGSSPAVSQAIQTQGYAHPGPNPVQIPQQQAQGQGQAAPVATALADNPQASQNPFETDPGYLASLAAEQAGSQQLDAALRAAQMQAIVQFGDPSLAGLAGFELDPLTAAMAQQNTQAGNSTVAQLGRQRDLNQETIQNQLAAHGMGFSGDLGYKTGQNQQQYGSELYNAQQGVLQSLAGASRDTLAQKQGLRSSTVGALTNAYNTYVQNPQFWGAAGVNDGGAKAAANTAASSPVASALGQSGQAKPSSKLAVKPPPNPFAARTAKQTVGYG